MKTPTRELEWLARLVEEIGHGVDAVESEQVYVSACALYRVVARKLKMREPSNDRENMDHINAALS